MKIKEVWTESILDSKRRKTIKVYIRTLDGVFSASAPSGVSTGKHEMPPYRGNIVEDTKTLTEFKLADIKKIDFKKFNDLLCLDTTLKKYVGANTLFSLQSAILKAIAAEQKKEVWQIINPEAKKMPIPIVNVIGGGKHSKRKRKPNFQEFLIIPNSKKWKENREIVKKIKKKIGWKLKFKEKKLILRRDDENAFLTKMTNSSVLDLLSHFRIKKGIDVAASTFYHHGFYLYNNPLRVWSKKEHIKYIIDLAKKYNLFYIEDPVEEEDFLGFSEIKKAVGRKTLIVGDDLTVTNLSRLKRAIKCDSINAVIVKPNQNGSIWETKNLLI